MIVNRGLTAVWTRLVMCIVYAVFGGPCFFVCARL